MLLISIIYFNVFSPFYCLLQRTHAGRNQLRGEFFSGWVRLNDSVKAQIGHQAEDMILDCSYNGVACGPQ